VARGLKIAVVFAPLLIVGYVIGLPYGPKGVALAYSTVMSLSLLPLIIWAVHGTSIRVRDIGMALSRPLASSMVAVALAFGSHVLFAQELSLLPRLVLEMLLFGVVYVVLLLLISDRKSYMDLIRQANSV